MPWERYAIIIGIPVATAIISFAFNWGWVKKTIQILTTKIDLVETKLELKKDAKGCDKDMERGEEQFKELKGAIDTLKEENGKHGIMLAGLEAKLEGLPDKITVKVADAMKDFKP